MRLRSLLFVPGDRPERMEKALDLGADALILDLEDSVAPANKAAARAAVAEFLSTLSLQGRGTAAKQPGRGAESVEDSPSPGSLRSPALSPGGRGLPYLFVRINPIGSAESDEDLDAVLSAAPDGIVLPKAEGARSVDDLRHRLRGHHVPILPIATETPAAVFRLGDYGPAAEHLAGLTWGAEDLPAAIGASASRDAAGAYLPPYQIARALTLFGAAAAGVQPIETVYPNFRDLDGLRRIAEAAARDGFTGMMAIHPSQVPVINAAFTPSPEAVAHARAVVAAFDANPHAGALQIDGRMIDAPHLKQARRILEKSESMTSIATPDFDFQLGEHAEMIRDVTRRFAEERIEPIAAKIDADDWFPKELWPDMGALGLHGITVDEADGGLGLGYLEHVIAVEEVSRASASIGLSYGAHSNLCVNQIRRWANDEQKAKYLPKLISGEHVGSLAMSEAGAGSDVVGMKLRADAVQGGYVLNGTKFWITNAAYADTLVVYAKTGEGSRGITAFLIEKDMPGFSIGQKIDKMGMRGSPTAELVFNDCEVPEANIMGPLNGGVGVLMSGLDYERAVLAGVQLGIMQACLDVTIPYVRERKQFGKPIGAFQLMQAKVADMYVALQSARAYTYAVAKSCDAGRTTRFDAAGAILLASESAVRVSLEAIQALGGAGYTKDWPVERYARDAKLLDIGAGTNEVRRMLIGRELIGAA